MVTCECGRVRPDDLFTIEKVMDSIKLAHGEKPTSNHYGVIINKCTMIGKKRFEREGRFYIKAVFAEKSNAIPYTTSHLIFLPRVIEMDRSHSFPGLQKWIEDFPGIRVASAETTNTLKEMKAMKEQMEQMKAFQKVAIEQMEQQQKELQKLRSGKQDKAR